MNGHVTQFLAAYHDGELNQRLNKRVVDHLAECPDCRSELERLETISDLLQAAPSLTMMPEDRFTAQVSLRLSRRQDEPERQLLERWLWRVIPLMLVGIWVIAQAVFWTTALVQTALPLSPAAASLGSLQLGSPWTIVMISLVFTAVCGLLFLSWLAAWWAGLTPTRSQQIVDEHAVRTD
jgi:predicted anti-sigma-YlaC factor YlaD